MAIEREYLESLSPVELDMIDAFLSERKDASVNPSTENYENLLPEVKCCPHCGSVHIVKNGFNKSIRRNGVKRQKYRCKDCRSVFVPTTGTIFRNTTVSYETWMRFIKCEINGMTLAQEADETKLSMTTCFAMRHKLHDAVGHNTEQLQGLIQLDPTYLNIRLKGTRSHNMPRKSKKRGNSKTSEGELRGISHHKVCIISAVDEHDGFLFKIAGIGVERRELLDSFSDCFRKGSEVIIDEKRCLESFVKDNGMTADIIPTHGFKSEKGRTLADINQLHQELSELIRAYEDGTISSENGCYFVDPRK